MRSRTWARLSGAVALVAATGLAGGPALAQAGAPSTTQGGDRNAAAASAPGPGGEQNQAAAPAGNASAPGAPELRVEEVRAFIGKDVLGPSGNVLGTLENVTTNADGRPEKLVVSRGGFLGLFQSQHTVDWAAAKPRIQDGKLVFALTPQDLTQTANK